MLDVVLDQAEPGEEFAPLLQLSNGLAVDEDELAIWLELKRAVRGVT
ncbi:MAG TPA: hypothetical protein H9837_07775 [Candidatus Brachybacterium merdigallinarum]|nr:hypothetical protein [Candidatus Brachybacterium merdigallinarum]